MRILFIVVSFFFSNVYGDQFRFDPPENFTLSPKYIALHHPVKTEHVAAQLYFDQGLTFLYAFNHEAAYWSFIKASEIDPAMAMAYWGRALVLGSNINIEIVPKRALVAYGAIQKAIELSLNGPENEKAYISALKERYSKDPDANKKDLAESYNKAMKELKNRYQDDPDASVLYAESILNLSPWNQWEDGKAKEATVQAIETLESVLKSHPMHLGANHYYVHILEASPHPERALMSAERLKSMLPTSGHILHMPAHIYLLVGDYEQAALTNERAIGADQEYIRLYGIEGTYPVHYLSHNYHFLSQAYAMLGNFQNAKQSAEALSKLYTPHFSQMPELEEYESTLMFVYLRFHKWKELLAIPKPNDEALITNTLWHFGRSGAFAGLKDTDQAVHERALFLKSKARIPSSSKYGYNDAPKIMTLAGYYLEGVLAEANGQNKDAIESYEQAVKVQDGLSYDEPPNWLFSVRDSLGAVFLKEKKFEDAERIFREDLKQHPRNGRSLFGLKTSLKAQNKMADYFWVNQTFEEAWRFSDTELNIDNL